MTIKTRKPAKASVKPTETLTRARKTAATQVAQAKSKSIEDVPESVTPAASGEGAAERPITGRGVFAVRTVGNAVSVEAAFLAEDGNVLRFPAVFPNREYAMAQVDELRALINRHFDELSAPSGN